MKTSERIGPETVLVTDGSIQYIEFDCLNKYRDVLLHCMSTRNGGVSRGECSTLNLGFNRKDSKENVLENYRRFCSAAGIDMKSLVAAVQVHETRVRTVDAGDMGKGFHKESDIKSVDGLLTVTPGVTMVTFHADCVPIFLFEPGIKAASLLHSGWRGTLKNIAAEALKAMSRLPGFNAGRLVAAIGPSIGKCCFDVDEDVYRLFKVKFEHDAFYEKAGRGKWRVDLQEIIVYELICGGMDRRNIHNSRICTRCRNDLFFSYRGDRGKTGSLAAFMQIKPIDGSIK